MRVKTFEPPDGERQTAANSPASTTTSAAATATTSSESYPAMGFTGGSVTTLPTYPSYAAAANLLDLFDDSADQDGDLDDNDSPMPPGLEDDLFDMLTNAEWTPYPGAGPTSDARGAYPGSAVDHRYPSQYQGQFQYVPYQQYAAGQYNYGQYPSAPPPYGSAPGARSMQTTSVKQEKLDVSNVQQPSPASPAKPGIVSTSSDALKVIAKKAGINSGESENSNESVSNLQSQGNQQVSVAVVAGTLPLSLPVSVQQSSPHSDLAISPQAADGHSPVPSGHSPGAATNSKGRGNTKVGTKVQVQDSSDRSAPVSPSGSTKSRSSLKVDVDEAVLIEEAKSKPIRHRKEPDIEDTKSRSVRNAINARVNRQKHKLYVDTLEKELDDLKAVNNELENKNQGLENQMKEMQKHVKYLENVIANDTMLAKVIGSLGDIKDVKLSSSFLPKKRKLSADTTSGTKKPNMTDVQSDKVSEGVTSGICLHVDQQNVSIECCEKCSAKAYDNFNNTTDDS